jgi:hypothetical protein
VADETRTYTQEEVDALIAEREGGLKSNRDQVLTEKKALEKQLEKYKNVDPDKYAQLVAQAEQAERDRASKEGDFKALEKQLIDKHTTEIEKRESRITQLTRALEQRLIDAEAAGVIAELKGSVKGLLPHVKPHIRVVEVDGEFVAQVVDGKGNPRIGDAKGNPMSIKQLVEEMKSDNELARLFEGTGSSGGGASRSSAAGGGGVTRIAAGDNNAFITNLEGIASGKVEVVL